MLSSYFIEIRTGTDYTMEEYDAAAGRLVSVMVALLSDSGNVAAVTYDATRESCHSEIEVSLEPFEAGHELVAKAVVDLVGEALIKFDKTKWTKLVKARPEAAEWQKLKINKRQVPIVQDAFTKEIPA